MQLKIVTIDVKLSDNTKRAIRSLLLPFIVLAGSTAIAQAYDTTWIAATQPLSANKLKAHFDEVHTCLAARETGHVVGKVGNKELLR